MISDTDKPVDVYNGYTISIYIEREREKEKEKERERKRERGREREREREGEREGERESCSAMQKNSYVKFYILLLIELDKIRFGADLIKTKCKLFCYIYIYIYIYIYCLISIFNLYCTHTDGVAYNDSFLFIGILL